MLNEKNLHNYQLKGIDHILNNPGAGLFLDMGLGKTITTLTAIDQLMYDRFEVEKVLVIAPKRVAEDTWMNEVEQWDHVKHLKLSLVLGTAKQRKEALIRKADIYVINRENVAWLISLYGSAFPFDMVVVDELSSFKNHASQRFKALRMVRPKVKRVVGLTGTPSPNGLIDLWSQLYLLDMGERLGRTIGNYRNRYFRPGRSNGYVVYEYKANVGSEQEIYDKISDICISMKAEDYLELPDKVVRDIPVHLSPEAQQSYNAFEKEQVLQLQDSEITAVNAAALTNKLLQYASGAIYDSDRNVHHVHDEKLDMLEEIIEAANSPVLIFYSFKHELNRIMKRLKSYKPRKLEVSQDIEDWNAGKIEVLLAHPASAGHGLNLQRGGNNIVWFSTPWSLELYLQANARLHRQGQTKPVMIFRLVAHNTHDQRVIKAIESKNTGQEALMEATKALISKYAR
jgi:SNF2 family DNA or RNA helicase